MATVEARFTVAADHPCLEGHFPGRPLVPAVVLLDQVFNAARAQWTTIGRLRAVSAAKFLRPVLPGQEVTVSLELQDVDDAVEFRCSTAAGIVAQGRLRIECRR